MSLTSIARVSLASVLVFAAAACGSSSNPSTGPGSSPAPAGGGTAPVGGGTTSAICSLVTAEEMGQFLSSTATIQPGLESDAAYRCDFQLTQAGVYAGIAGVRYDPNTLAETKTTSEGAGYTGGADETVGGHPAYWNGDLESLFVDLGSQRLVVQLVLSGTVTATEALAQQVMEKALSRI